MVGVTRHDLRSREMATRQKRAPRQRQGRRTYAERRRIPWPAVVVVSIVAIAAVVIIRQLDIGAPGEQVDPGDV